MLTMWGNTDWQTGVQHLSQVHGDNAGACVYRRSVTAALEPKMLTSCSSYASMFLFIMSMHGPNTRSNAATSNTTQTHTNIDVEVEQGITSHQTYHRSYPGWVFIGIISFQGSTALHLYPKNAFWREHLQHEPMENVFVYILTTDKAIITKLDKNIKQVRQSFKQTVHWY